MHIIIIIQVVRNTKWYSSILGSKEKYKWSSHRVTPDRNQ